jgi:hypothetical protein|tara:strand:+ start:57 stop:731 length:675 start_codon:yes stop_codon:yes gene_type:complete
MQIIDPVYWKVWWEAIQKGYNPKDLMYSIGPDQIESKTWLIDTLITPLPGNRIHSPAVELSKFENLSIHIYGGWYGYPLIDMLLEQFPNISKITNIDLDEDALALCRKFTNEKHLQDIVFFKMQDVLAPLNNGDNKDKDVKLVINTSSEHMPDLPELIANKNYGDNCMFVLQSNNMFHIVDQHINCSNSIEEFIEKSGLTKIIFANTYKMKNGYDRYMVIGNHR